MACPFRLTPSKGSLTCMSSVTSPIAARGLVLDVCPISNLRTRAVASLGEHALPDLVAAGMSCSVSTDDPAMFGTDLTADYAAAARLGVGPRACYRLASPGGHWHRHPRPARPCGCAAFR